MDNQVQNMLITEEIEEELKNQRIKSRFEQTKEIVYEKKKQKKVQNEKEIP